MRRPVLISIGSPIVSRAPGTVGSAALAEDLERRDGQEAAVQRQLEIAVLAHDRVVHGDELGAVGERALDLHLGDQARHAVHHLSLAEHLAADAHQLGDAASVADQLEQDGRDQRDGLGIAQPQPAREPLLRDRARAVQHELVELPRGQVHRMSLPTSDG